MPSYVIESPTAAEATTPEDFGGTYELETDHAGKLIEQLTSFFRDGPRNQALMRALGAQVQELEQATWDVFNAFDLDTATGHRLDLLGKIVGEGRSDRSDTDYRAAIRVRALINRSNGKLPELLTIAGLLASAATIHARETYPATISIDFDDHGAVKWALIVRLLTQAKGGGIRLLATTGYGEFAVGSEDGTPAGGVIGSEDGTPAGFLVGAA